MNENPKHAEGAKKCPLDLLPPVALEQIAWAHKAGSDSYGKFNWRTQPIQMSTYVASMLRHCLAWAGGEDIDPKSGLSHLAHLGANVNLLLDAAHCGTLIDDRPKMPMQVTVSPGLSAPDASMVPPSGAYLTWMELMKEDPTLSSHPVPEDFAVPTGMNGIRPPQYRDLEVNEVIQGGDERRPRMMFHIGWKPVDEREAGFRVTAANEGCYRRPIITPSPPTP